MAPEPRPARRRVLVVEDNDDARESLCLVLAARGWEVRDAADGAEALRVALEWRPDAVVSDIGLPCLDGWELGRRVRAGLGREVLLVAVTGFANLNDRQRSLAAGFDAHLAKPAEPEDLLALLGPARRVAEDRAARGGCAASDEGPARLPPYLTASAFPSCDAPGAVRSGATPPPATPGAAAPTSR